VIVVNDNRSLNQETEIFASAYGGMQPTGLEMWQFRDLNIAKVAESLGCLGFRVEQPGEIAPALVQALEAERPAVLDVVSDLEALAPDPWG
jgi:acetolactate synthase-1/2/3 large subunit